MFKEVISELHYTPIRATAEDQITIQIYTALGVNTCTIYKHTRWKYAHETDNCWRTFDAWNWITNQPFRVTEADEARIIFWLTQHGIAPK